jgi:hypothetical protein
VHHVQEGVAPGGTVRPAVHHALVRWPAFEERR